MTFSTDDNNNGLVTTQYSFGQGHDGQQLDVCIEDVVDSDAVALGGPRGCVPTVLQKKQGFRFQLGVLATQQASFPAQGKDEVSTEAALHLSALPLGAVHRRIRGKPLPPVRGGAYRCRGVGRRSGTSRSARRRGS